MLAMPSGVVERRRRLRVCAVRAGDLRDDIGGKFPLQLFALRCRDVFYACGRHIADDVPNLPSRYVV